jgi:cardiolipin synthase (CMP-forming)
VAGGEVVDPIFDKIFVIAVVAALLAEGRLTPAELALIVTRDALILAGAAALVIVRRRVRLRARRSGKVVTVLQFAALLAAITWGAAVRAAAIAAAMAGVIAAADYAAAARRSLHRSERAGYDPAPRGPAARDRR